MLSLSLACGLGAAAQSASSTSSDIGLWRAIKDSTSPALFNDLIAKFPSSPLTALARLRANELVGLNPGPTTRAIGAELPPIRNIADKTQSTGVEVPTVKDIRQRAVAVALRAGKIISAPKSASKPIADVEAEQVLILGDKGQNDWIRVIAPGGEPGYVPSDLVLRSTPEESFFAGIMNPLAAVARPLAPVSESPDRCIDQPSRACILGLIEGQLAGLKNSERPQFLAMTASVLLNLGQLDIGRHYFEQALTAARAVSQSKYNDVNYNRVLPLADVANTLADLGQPRWALEVYAEAAFFARLSHAKGDLYSDAGEKAESLEEIAEALGMHGFRRQAAALFAEAIQSARMMPEDTNFNINLMVSRVSEIASSRVKIGDLDGGLESLAAAISVASRMTYLYPNGVEDTTRGLRQESLAVNVAKLGYFELGIRLAHAIGNLDARQDALAEIAELLAPVDRHAASELVDEVMKFDKASADAAARLVKANYIAPGIWIFGRVNSSSKYDRRNMVEALAGANAFDQAIATVNTIADEDYYKRGICAIAEQMALVGREADKDRLIQAMRYPSPTACAEGISSVKRQAFNDQIAVALDARSWEPVAQLIQGSSAFDDGVFAALPKMAYEHPDAAAFTKLYRTMPSGHGAARTYVLIALLSSI
jgi:hypothetical protein